MRKLIYHILYRFLGMLPGVLAVAFATAQKPIQHIVVDQCETIELSVQEMPGDRYTWDLYSDSTANFAWDQGDMDPALYFEGGMYAGTTVRVNNLPAGRYFLRVMVWDEVNCTNNLLVFLLDVLPALPTAVFEADPFCYGDVNEARIILTGRGPWEIVYTWDDETNKQIITLNGETDVQYIGLPVLDPGTYRFWIMEVTDQCSVRSYPDPEKVEVIIHPKPRTTRIYVKPDEENE